MSVGLGWGAFRAPVSPFSRRFLAAASMTLAAALAGCTTDGQPGVASIQPRGATVAFESIDGPPPGQFQTLVRNLNDEAQSRRLAVLSREATSAYRVRGYLAAKVAGGQTTISWVWDVFDRDEQRTLRINGEEIVKRSGKAADAWNVVDDAMSRRIASASMEQLGAFLTAPDTVPVASAPRATPVALSGVADTSPEAAGIFRIFRADADPAPPQPADAQGHAAASGPVPLPPQRPETSAGNTPAGRATVQASL